MKKQINQTKEEKRLEDFKKIAENWDNLSEYAKGKMDGIISTMATMTEQKAGQGNVETISNPVAVLDCDSDTG